MQQNQLNQIETGTLVQKNSVILFRIEKSKTNMESESSFTFPPYLEMVYGPNFNLLII